SATRAPSQAAGRPFHAREQDICWSSEPVVTSSIRPPPAAAVAATGEAAEAAAAAAAAGTGGVVVGGRGCSRCVRGEQCSFHVWVRPPAHWVLPPVAPASSERENGGEGGNGGEAESSGGSVERRWWKKDVTLSLLGPALGHGEVQCLDPPACSQLLVSYRLWDVGTYSATLHVGCANLNFSLAFAAHFNSTYRHDLATWSLSIGWPESASEKIHGSAAGAADNDDDDGGDSAARSSSDDRVLLDDVAAGDEALGEGDTTFPDTTFPDTTSTDTTSPDTTSTDTTFPDTTSTDTTSPDTTSTDTTFPDTTSPNAASPSRQPSPCAHSIPGRWMKGRSGKYIWAFFPCAPSESPPSRWIEQLASRGIREINIVGDSHQRVLALHLHWLLSGEADKRIRKGHLDFSKESRNERNESMRINFYWVDGIYRNDEFGC
ncbi:unnamed protein product, partial [Closterium sp. Yama58-4]